MSNEPTPGPIIESGTVEESKKSCPPMRDDTLKNVKSELLDVAIAPPTPTEVQHPKPHPTPNQCEVF
jgi:hypothetical protein